MTKNKQRNKKRINIGILHINFSREIFKNQELCLIYDSSKSF